MQEQWHLAVPSLAAAGVSDFLDGYFARRSGRHSVLGSYLDPLADKVLVGAVVGSLGYTVRRALARNIFASAACRPLCLQLLSG